MKAVLISLFILSYCTGYAQLSVEWTSTENKYQAQMITPHFEDVSDDLFFSIGPNGMPQYGQHVGWNLEEYSVGTARFFHVKKGDWDRSAIRATTSHVTHGTAPNPFPIDDNLDVNMGEDWIKLGTSWNFSHDNYNIAIISFTNQGNKPLDTGTITFSHPDHSFIRMDGMFIYNHWVHYVGEDEDGITKSYEFKFDNLMPGEIRHLYLVIDISRKTSFSIPPSEFKVEMDGVQSASVVADGIVPPHDPNALTLMTALENTPPIYNCEQYSHVDELAEICEREQLFWVFCREFGSPKCPIKHSLHYPYCNIDSEELTYRITCLNDGAGVAKDIKMDATFNLVSSPFYEEFFHYESSLPATGYFKYPNAMFTMEEAFLPGLSDENHVYTYDECSAQVIFQVKTKCNIKEKIRAIAAITFYDIENNPVDPVITNDVYVVPEQGVYNNYDPDCISCISAKGSDASDQLDEQSTLTWVNSSLHLSLESIKKDDPVNVHIFGSSGIMLKSMKIQPSGLGRIDQHINTSSLPSGIYFVSIQNGKERTVKKFIIP